MNIHLKCAMIVLFAATLPVVRGDDNVATQPATQTSALADELGRKLVWKIADDDAKGATELIEAGANVNIKVGRRRGGGSLVTSLWMAAARDSYFDIAVALIQHGADCNAKCLGEATPLHNACLWGSRRQVKLLVKAGADVNAHDRFGNTPLHYVSSGWQGSTDARIEIIDALLFGNAEINPVNAKQQTPLDMAIQIENSNMERVLKSAGGKRRIDLPSPTSRPIGEPRPGEIKSKLLSK